MDTNNAYRVLGLAPGASEDEVKAAYRALAQQYAPEAKPEGPERKEAEARMAELNEAFDTLISVLRTGVNHTQQAAQGSPDRAAAYRAIRQMIDSGNVDGALAQLGAMTGGANDAEWNFLMGSAYYYKRWLAEAMRYFEAACRLAPNNREYEAALRNLQNNAAGAMPGNPYGAQGPYGTQAVGCSCCDMCMAMACMDMCCSCGRGGC